MNEEVGKMLDFVEFVTDKFADNHKPWKYTRDTEGLKHIRYVGDSTGYFHWARRLRRFLRDITIDYIKPMKLHKQIVIKRINWFQQVGISWYVCMQKEDHLPDGTVNGNITFWEEDGEYITMFCPYVGREVLKFLRAEPDNPYAQEIIRAMMETREVSWPTAGEDA